MPFLTLFFGCAVNHHWFVSIAGGIPCSFQRVCSTNTMRSWSNVILAWRPWWREHLALGQALSMTRVMPCSQDILLCIFQRLWALWQMCLKGTTNPCLLTHLFKGCVIGQGFFLSEKQIWEQWTFTWVISLPQLLVLYLTFVMVVCMGILSTFGHCFWRLPFFSWSYARWWLTSHCTCFVDEISRVQ